MQLHDEENFQQMKKISEVSTANQDEIEITESLSLECARCHHTHVKKRKNEIGHHKRFTAWKIDNIKQFERENSLQHYSE